MAEPISGMDRLINSQMITEITQILDARMRSINDIDKTDLWLNGLKNIGVDEILDMIADAGRK